MSTPNPALVAAAPALISVLQALQQFETAMGPNPLMWVANYPGAKLQLVGAVMLQFPALATAEGGVVENLINTQASTWITQLKALQTA